MASHTSSDGSRGRDPDIGIPDGEATSTGREVDGRALSDDDVFEVLYSDRRRRVLGYLRDGDGTATASELAEHIAAAENGTAVRELSSYERKRVYVSLYQTHLPKMDDAGVVDYDDGRKTVRLLGTAEELEPYLAGETRPVGQRTLVAATLIVAAIVLFGGLQVGVLAAIPPSTWAVLGVVGLVGVACCEMYNLSIG